MSEIGGDMNIGNAKTIGESRFPLRSWTDFHPPPVGKPGQNQYDYTRTYRKAQRAALECQRGSTEVRDALHDCV